MARTGTGSFSDAFIFFQVKPLYGHFLSFIQNIVSTERYYSCIVLSSSTETISSCLVLDYTVLIKKILQNNSNHAIIIQASFLMLQIVLALFNSIFRNFLIGLYISLHCSTTNMLYMYHSSPNHFFKVSFWVLEYSQQYL